MKRIQLFALVSALTVMGLASCQPVETAPEKQETGKGHSVIFNVQVEPEAATKTALRLQFIPDWRYTDTDDIHIFETASTDGVATQILKANQVDIFTEDNDQKAYFHAWFDDISVIINPSGVLTKASAPVYNYTSIMAATETEGDELRFVLPSTQYPTSTSSFDPKADFLIGQCATTYNDFIQPDQRLNLNFIRPVAIGRFAIVGLEGSSVQSVKVTFEQPIAGYTTYGKVDFEESTAEFTSDDSDKVLTLLYPEGRRKSTIFNAFFLALEGRKKAVSMEVRTDSYIFTKNYPNTTWTLNKDIFNEIVIDMSTATKTALLDQEMQFKDGEGTPVSEITYDLVENGGSVDAFVSPVFSRESACQTEVTFASNNEEVATVDADGNIALTGAAGVAVITASADGDATHKAGTATVTITVVTPEVTFYEAKGIDNDVEYLIVSNGKAVKYTATGMSFEDVTVSEGTITIDNSLLEGLLWKAAAIDATSEFATYGTHTFTCSGNKLMRESDGAGSMALAASDAAMSKYMAWNYDGAKFWNHSVNGENINDFCLTYDSADGWAFEYQSTPTTLLYTTLKPREIAFTTTEFTFDRYTDTDFTAPTIDGATYVSSDTDIAAVDPATGIVTLAGKTKTGTVTITATVAAGNGFQGASASYTIEVGDSDPGQMSKPILVYLEPATELVAGEEYYLVSNGMVLARDGANASAVEFDADKVAAVVDVDLVDNIAWTLAKQTGTITRGNEYVFTQGEYFFGIAMNTNQSTYTYTVEVNDGREVSNNVTIQDHNISLTNNQIYYAGNSSNYYIFYNTTDNKWDNEKVSSSSTPAATSTTALYVAKDTRDEQTAQFVDADSEPVTAVEFDLASGADFVAPTLDGMYYGDVTYSTDDTHGVITLDEATGAITINKKGGPVTITANIAGTTYYKPTTASYTLTVTNSNATESVYNKVTSVSDLEVGAKYLIVFEGLANDEDDGDPKVFEAKVDGSELSKDAGHDVTIENGVITSDLFDEYTFTLEEGYYLKADNVNKYMYPMQKSGTGGAFGAENSATNKLTITFSNGIASIACNSRYVVWSTSSHYFSVNSSTSSTSATGICLYKLYDGRQPQNMQFAAAEAQFDVFSNDWVEDKGIPALDGNETTPVYESSNTAVATVNETTGAVEIQSGVKSGDTAVITATAPQNDNYKTATASYTIRIVNNDPNIATYTKVTSASDLEADAKYILVYETNKKVFKPILKTSGISFDKNSNNAVDVVINGEEIASNDLTDYQLTFEAGKFMYVASADKYLYPGASGDDAIGAEDIDLDHSIAITISSGVATIKCSDSDNHLYWSTSGYFSSISQTGSSYVSTLSLYKLNDSRTAQTLAFSGNEAKYDIANSEWTVEVPTLSGADTDVTFTSSDESVATVTKVDNTTVTVTIASGAMKNDVAVIKATAAGTTTVKPATAFFKVTVIDPNVPKYYKVDELENGKEYLIVSNGYALSLSGTSVKADAITETETEGVIQFDESATSNSPLWTATVSGTSVKVKNGSNYLRHSSSGASFSIGTSDSRNAIVYDAANNTVKVGNYYLNYSGSSFSLNSSATNTSAAFYSATKPLPSLEFDKTSIKYDVATSTWSSAMPVLSPAGAIAKVDVEVDVTEPIIQDVDTDGDTFIVTLADDLTELVGHTATVTVYAKNSGEFKNESASFTVEVIDSSTIPTYTKVSEITSGATYLIVSTDANSYNGLGQKRAFAGTTSGSVVEVDGTSGTITGDFSACEFVITAEGDATYSLNGPNGYVTGNSATDPYIQVSSSKVTVSLTDAATLKADTSTDGVVSDAFYFYYLKSGSIEALYLNSNGNFKMGGSGRKYGVYLYKKN